MHAPNPAKIMGIYEKKIVQGFIAFGFLLSCPPSVGELRNE